MANFEDLIGVCQIVDTVCYWTNFHSFEWPNIELVIDHLVTLLTVPAKRLELFRCRAASMIWDKDNCRVIVMLLNWRCKLTKQRCLFCRIIGYYKKCRLRRPGIFFLTRILYVKAAYGLLVFVYRHISVSQKNIFCSSREEKYVKANE